MDCSLVCIYDHSTQRAKVVACFCTSSWHDVRRFASTRVGKELSSLHSATSRR